MGAKQHNGELPPQIKHIEVSDKGHLGLLNLESSDYHIEAFGQVVSLSALTRLAANASSSYQYIAPAKVTNVKQGGGSRKEKEKQKPNTVTKIKKNKII